MAKRILCLFDHSGIMGSPWAEDGFDVICIDRKNTPARVGNFIFLNLDLTDRPTLYEIFDETPPNLIVAFPDCTHLAASGSAFFATKSLKDPATQLRALELFKLSEILATRYDVPSLTENPVGIVSQFYRPPEAYIHPYEYGGYLPEDDIHPWWPDYIPARDAYTKKTGLWLHKISDIPPKKPVPVSITGSPQYRKLGGKSEKTKEIRSLTPRGSALAFHQHMRDKI